MQTIADRIRQEEQKVNKTTIARRMLADGFSIDKVVKMTQLPKKEVEKLAKENS